MVCLGALQLAATAECKTKGGQSTQARERPGSRFRHDRDRKAGGSDRELIEVVGAAGSTEHQGGFVLSSGVAAGGEESIGAARRQIASLQRQSDQVGWHVLIGAKEGALVVQILRVPRVIASGSGDRIRKARGSGISAWMREATHRDGKVVVDVGAVALQKEVKTADDGGATLQ